MSILKGSIKTSSGDILYPQTSIDKVDLNSASAQLVALNAGTSADVMNFKSRSSTYSYIGFQNSSGNTLGYIGVGSSGPIFYDGSTTKSLCCLPALPADAGTKNYILKLVRGTLTWVVDPDIIYYPLS